MDTRLWPTPAARTPGCALTIGGADVRDLVAQHGSPLFVLDDHKRGKPQEITSRRLLSK